MTMLFRDERPTTAARPLNPRQIIARGLPPDPPARGSFSDSAGVDSLGHGAPCLIADRRSAPLPARMTRRRQLRAAPASQVALGRGALDPLAVLAALCGPGREVAALNLHPLQALLPPDDLAAAVERVVITAVAQARPPARAPGAHAGHACGALKRLTPSLART